MEQLKTNVDKTACSLMWPHSYKKFCDILFKSYRIYNLSSFLPEKDNDIDLKTTSIEHFVLQKSRGVG